MIHIDGVFKGYELKYTDNGTPILDIFIGSKNEETPFLFASWVVPPFLTWTLWTRFQSTSLSSPTPLLVFAPLTTAPSSTWRVSTSALYMGLETSPCAA